MGYHPRIETEEYVNLITTRSRNSELWFINNKKLEEAILGYIAKYSQIYEVELYALAIQGNHIHLEAGFPKLNRAAFMRDLNSTIARAVNRFCEEYEGGRFWGRRYSNEFIGLREDVEDKFFYCVLQSVQDGLSRTINGNGYNCFFDAIQDVRKIYKVINWTAYNEAKRYGRDVDIKDYEEEYPLIFKRLPAYEDFSQDEYIQHMKKSLHERRAQVIEKRTSQGLGFSKRESLKRTRPGSKPRKTKTSHRTSHRPRVLTKCNKTRSIMKTWYFHMYFEFKEVSRSYLEGEIDVDFPPGMYKPPTIIH